MSYRDWKEKTSDFQTMDVRGVTGNFLEGIKKMAIAKSVGDGIEIIQTFEPIPLYEVMLQLGYEHHTEKMAENEYHSYFYRIREQGSLEALPERPTVIANYPMIDEKLGEIAVEFWDLTWQSENRYLDYNTREGI